MFSLRRGQPTLLLILWAAVVAGGFASQRWLTYAQAQAAGGNVRRGEKGTVVCYADRFAPKGEGARAADEDRDARQIAFLKRFTVFNVDQCEALTAAPEQPVRLDILPQVQALIDASGADIRIGGLSRTPLSPRGSDPQRSWPDLDLEHRHKPMSRRSRDTASTRGSLPRCRARRRPWNMVSYIAPRKR